MSSGAERPYYLERRLVRETFDAAAAGYDEAAVLQREVAARMAERLDLIKLTPRRIADVGAGTGDATLTLGRRYRGAQVVALDLAPRMLVQARRKLPRLLRWPRRFHFVCGDAQQLPLAGGGVDLLFSNLTLQWCNDLDAVFREFRRVLAPGGLLMFSTFGPDTLKELRASWRRVDAYTHVNLFMDMHDIGDALVRSGFAAPVMDVETITLTYRELRRLMQDLKAIGAHNVTAGRRRGLMTAARLAELERAYADYRREGLYPATYEVVYGHAWAPTGTAQQAGEPGVATVPLTALRRRGGREAP